MLIFAVRDFISVMVVENYTRQVEVEPYLQAIVLLYLISSLHFHFEVISF